jgi:hypothetical protein
MTNLTIFIDDTHLFEDGTYPLVIQVFHAGQKRRIRTPYRFVRVLSSDVDQGYVHCRCMSVVGDSQEDVTSYLAGALASIKHAMTHLEASGKEYKVQDILHLAGLPQHLPKEPALPKKKR